MRPATRYGCEPSHGRRSGASALCLTALLAIAVQWPAIALAQRAIPRSSDEQPELPPFEPPEREEGLILPRFPIPKRPDTQGLAGQVRVFVRGYRIVGNTVVPDAELEKLTEPFSDRAVSFSELEALRDRLTLAYIERGYVSSGAVIPDQQIEDGIVEIRIVEGRLAEVVIDSDGRFRASYLRSRIAARPDEPLNVHELERRLQILQQDPRIRRIDVKLQPGEERGQSILRVEVDEAPSYWARFEASNHEVPAVGAEGGRVALARCGACPPQGPCLT